MSIYSGTAGYTPHGMEGGQRIDLDKFTSAFIKDGCFMIWFENGCFDHDIRLTKEQTSALIEFLKAQLPPNEKQPK